MKDLLEKDNLIKPCKEGDIIEGTVIGEEKSGVFLDLGPYGTGIVKKKEFQNAKKELKIGDKVFGKITNLENELGYVELSMGSALEELALKELREKKEKGEVVSVKILRVNKGGLISEISGIQAFLPVSQLSKEHYPKVEGGEVGKILEKLQKFIGKELKVKIIDFSPQNNQVILSEKAKEMDKMKENLKYYKVGDVVEGEIIGVTHFGAFIRFPIQNFKKQDEKKSPGVIEGLIHISELDWKVIKDPASIVKVGDMVKAKIIDISNNRVFLSLKALKEPSKQ